MADRKISDLTALTAPAAGDYLPIVDISEASAANKNKRITIEELLRGAPDGTAAAPSIGFESDPNTGIYRPGADQLAISTGGTERVRIDSSGRLLVGTSTPRSIVGITPQIQLEGTSAATSTASLTTNTADVNSAYLLFTKSRGTAVSAMTIVNDGDDLGNIWFQGTDGSFPRAAATIKAQVDGTPGTNDMPGRLVFSTTADEASSPTERLRITSAGVVQVADAGNIAVGTTTGTKIGTATTQKLGFYNATPVVQPTAVADATDAASVITQLNALLSRMRNLGLIAT